MTLSETSPDVRCSALFPSWAPIIVNGWWISIGEVTGYVPSAKSIVSPDEDARTAS